jgi:hypothetical protein
MAGLRLGRLFISSHVWLSAPARPKIYARFAIIESVVNDRDRRGAGHGLSVKLMRDIPMAQTYSIPDDISFYTRYGHGTTPVSPPSRPLRNSLIAAAAALAFAGVAITYGVGRLPPVEKFKPAITPMSFIISDAQPRTPLETLPPDVAAQARTQPSPVSATVRAPDIPAALYGEYGEPARRDVAVDDDAPPTYPDAAATADTMAEPSDAIVDDPQDDAPQTADQM